MAAAGRSLLHDTLVALAQPRRAWPTAVLAVALIVAQVYFTPSVRAAAVAVAMLLGFIVVAPWLWRALFGRAAQGGLSSVSKLAIYTVVGLFVVFVLAGLIPHALGLPRTFLTVEGSVLVEPALFWVGGWGLGRDIELEHDSRRSEARADKLESQAQQAQLLAIRAHLDPHFLFNTLNAIAEWCREDGEVAERALLTLSEMLRTILVGAKGAAWPMAKELALAEQLFSLHRVRDPGLFDLSWRVDPAVATVQVPPMLLLPVIENAMTHGPAAGFRGTVTLTATRDTAPRTTVRITLENPGPYQPAAPGEGLAMVRQRLALAYDCGAGIDAMAGDGQGDTATTRVVVWFPADGPAVTT